MRTGDEVTLSQGLLERRLTRPFKYFDRVESSNDEALAWLAAGAPEGAAVIANEQTRGRGRKGRDWHTPPNVALALSLILKPDSALLPRLNMVAALSVYDLARETGCQVVGIKWPNDVQVNGLKVSGVSAGSHLGSEKATRRRPWHRRERSHGFQRRRTARNRHQPGRCRQETAGPR